MVRNAVYLITGFLLATASVAFAGGLGLGPIGWLDPNQFVEGCPEGYICVTEEEYELHWDVCPLGEEPTATPENGNGNGDPTPTPEITPTPEVTPTPENGEREACNRGIGNLEEDCDPGNSSGQGKGEGRPAGEDRDEAEGAPPPRKGGGKPDK